MMSTMLPYIGPFPTHEFFVAIGTSVGVVIFMIEARRRGQTGDQVIQVVVGGLVGGALLMRLGTWAQHLDLRDNASLAEQWAYGNRSVLGGLFGAWLGVHIAKRLVGYKLRTGDLFAPAVAAGMAVGRFGCFFTELPGTPTHLPWAVDGRHPSFIYEIVFHLAAFCLLWFWLRHKGLPPGTTFVWYIAAYGVFRFLVEFVRGNEVVWMDLTRPQLFLMCTIPIVLTRIALQWRAGAYSSRAVGREPALVADSEAAAVAA